MIFVHFRMHFNIESHLLFHNQSNVLIKFIVIIINAIIVLYQILKQERRQYDNNRFLRNDNKILKSHRMQKFMEI